MDNYYDEISEGYLELHRDEQLAKAAIIQRELPRKRGESLLDIGCGPGFFDWGTGTVGIDPSIALLSKAPFIKVQAVAEDLPFKDSSFDIIVSLTAMQNFRDPGKAVDEMQRVGKRFAISFLKKTGRIAELDSAIRSRLEVFKVIEEDKDFIYLANKI
jgi:ubiquinone/menaquinone biosynthesis C-methylase UbiE